MKTINFTLERSPEDKFSLWTKRDLANKFGYLRFLLNNRKFSDVEGSMARGSFSEIKSYFLHFDGKHEEYPLKTLHSLVESTLLRLHNVHDAKEIEKIQDAYYVVQTMWNSYDPFIEKSQEVLDLFYHVQLIFATYNQWDFPTHFKEHIIYSLYSKHEVLEKFICTVNEYEVTFKDKSNVIKRDLRGMFAEIRDTINELDTIMLLEQTYDA